MKPHIHPFLIFLSALLLVSLACGQSVPVTPFPVRENPASDSGETIYGFFPFKFVVGFTGIDYDKLLAVFPADLRELGMIWVYTGLERSDGCPKRGLSVWDAYLGLPLQK
jgi:hypothetical protein